MEDQQGGWLGAYGGGGGRPRDLNSIKEPISPNSIESATSSISENSSEGTITNISKVSTTLGTTHYITRVTCSGRVILATH